MPITCDHRIHQNSRWDPYAFPHRPSYAANRSPWCNPESFWCPRVSRHSSRAGPFMQTGAWDTGALPATYQNFPLLTGSQIGRKQLLLGAEGCTYFMLALLDLLSHLLPAIRDNIGTFKVIDTVLGKLENCYDRASLIISQALLQFFPSSSMGSSSSFFCVPSSLVAFLAGSSSPFKSSCLLYFYPSRLSCTKSLHSWASLTVRL